MPIRLKPLSRQVVVITGASSGIGLATARKAAERGARLMLVARNEDALRQVCEEIRARGGTADFAVADVGDADQVERAADLAVQRFGGIDTWVNNAGVAIYAPLEQTPRDEHERMLRTNYWGVVNGSLAAVRRMKSGQAGHALITVGSVTSDMGSPILGAYAATKHAAKGFLDSLRIELLREGAPIAVTLIKPSGIGSPLGQHVANHLDGQARIPPPVYAPDLVADAILHAAEHRMRELVVGGAGQAQILFATHMPALFDRLAGLIVPVLTDDRIPETRVNNLARPMAGGQARGAYERPRPFSLYTAARLHPGLALGALVMLAAAASAARPARRRRWRP